MKLADLQRAFCLDMANWRIEEVVNGTEPIMGMLPPLDPNWVEPNGVWTDEGSYLHANEKRWPAPPVHKGSR